MIELPLNLINAKSPYEVSYAPNLQLFHSVIIVLFIFSYYISHHTSYISVKQVPVACVLFTLLFSLIVSTGLTWLTLKLFLSSYTT